MRQFNLQSRKHTRQLIRSFKSIESPLIGKDKCLICDLKWLAVITKEPLESRYSSASVFLHQLLAHLFSIKDSFESSKLSRGQSFRDFLRAPANFERR